jgi:hypothetical protein
MVGRSDTEAKNRSSSSTSLIDGSGDDFQFVPLSDGLGFQGQGFQQSAREIESVHQGLRDGGRSGESVATASLEKRPPAKPPAEMGSGGLGLGRQTQRPASEKAAKGEKSLTELLNQLPPSLDFVDELATRGAATSVAPVVVQPLTGPGIGRQQAPGAPSLLSSPMSARQTPFPAPGTKAGSPDGRARQVARVGQVAPVVSPATKQVAHEEARSAGPLLAANFPAALVDGLIVAGFSILCLVSILVVTNVNLVGLLTSTTTDVSARIHLGLLGLFVLHFYLLVSRSFFGASVGEWAFETGLGTQDQRDRLLYPLQVLWRTVLCTGTLFLLPILSWLIGRDVLAILSGVSLEQRPD